MKKALSWAIGCVMLTLSTTAGAIDNGSIADKDLTNWGNTGATAAPVKDDTRAAYWWWPTEPATNANDSEIWGNQGKVMHIYTVEQPVTPPTVTPTPAPIPARQKPLFNHVLFDFDKSTLKPEGKAELDKIIAELKANPKDTIVIEGHTCDIGEASYNEGLGQRRANAVSKYLTDNGIDPARLSTKSLGETMPAVPNDSAANRKLNRRAQFDWTIVN